VQRRRLVSLPERDRIGDLHTRERLVKDDVATDEHQLLRRVHARRARRRWRAEERLAEQALLDGQSALRCLDSRNLRVDVHERSVP